MKTMKKCGLILLFFVTTILFFKTNSYAGFQKWNALDYDVKINKDGSMDVVETWDVYIDSTNTLFKDFEVSSSDVYRITDVKITQVNNTTETPLEQIFVEQYHVDSGCYYGLQIDNSTFEIAWNVGLDDSSDYRVYKMYYTVENAVKIYNDCTEIYWQFLSDKNAMTGSNVTGTIKLPEKVNDIEKLRVWGHGDYAAEIIKKSEDEVHFSLNSIKSNKMLEIRVITEDNIYSQCGNIYNKNHLNDVLSEEKVWADEANKEREEAKRAVLIFKIIIVMIILANVCIFICCILKSKKYRSIGKELKEKYSYPKNDLKYFRDIPDEKNATPARAMYMYKFNSNNSIITNDISKIFSATILDLSLKGLITFETVNEKEVRILKTSKTNDTIELSTDEKIIYDLLKDAMTGKDSITPKEFSKYASKKYESVYSKLNRLDDIVMNYEIAAEKISKERIKTSKEWNSKFTIFMVLSVISIFFIFIIPALTIGFGILALVCRKNYIYVSILTDVGNEEVAQWKGLKRYMEDYSMLDEKLVPDIVLWEKYLVYATAFGISKKVIEQLKSVHPEMFIETNSNGIRDYAYWYMITNSNFGEKQFENFSRSLEKVYNTARSAYNTANTSSSSGSGGGGGFSGGGGGRRWRRKLWRSLNPIPKI